MQKKVVIIGGGVAGLAAGIYAQLNGFNTEIIEMHTQSGGQCTAWTRQGYRFDHCLHWLVGTSAGPFHELWRETNVLNDETKVVDHHIFLRLTDERLQDFVIYTNIDEWENYLNLQFPSDGAAIRRMCRDMRKAASFELFTDPPAMRHWGTYVRSARQMLPALPIFFKYRKRTCREYLRDLNFHNERLYTTLDAIYGDNEFPALVFLMMLSWFHQKNAGYVIGGSLPLAERMTERYGSLGGKLTLGKRVAKIAVSDGKAAGVLLGDGTEVGADYVISAADGHSTIFDLLEGKYTSKLIEEAYGTWPVYPSMVQVAFGVNRQIKATSSVHAVMARGKRIGMTTLPQSYSFMNYNFDPTMAPKGKTVITLRFESPWPIWKDLDDAAYQAEKAHIEKDARALLEQHYPGVTPFIEVVDVATPRTEARFTGVWQGAYEGFLPTNKNFSKTLPMELPGLQNFYLAGQWLTPGGGLPPSALSGKWAIELICKREGKAFKHHGAVEANVPATVE